jgi:ammonia channel protein AmtB
MDSVLEVLGIFLRVFIATFVSIGAGVLAAVLVEVLGLGSPDMAFGLVAGIVAAEQRSWVRNG